MICPVCSAEVAIELVSKGGQTNQNKQELNKNNHVVKRGITTNEHEIPSNKHEINTKGEAGGGDPIRVSSDLLPDPDHPDHPDQDPKPSAPDPFGSSISNPDPDPAEDQVTTPDARAKRGRGTAVVYPAEFEELWAKTGRQGNKHPAFRVWDKIKPLVTLNTLIERWAEWEQTDRWREGFIPHLRTWLNVRGWQDEPPAHEFNRSRGARGAALNMQHGENWLAKRGGGDR
jgi:hypothetical protein